MFRHALYTSLRHSLGVVNKVGGQLMFGGVVDMSYGEVDSAAGSMYVQVRRTSQLHRMPRHRPPTVSGDSVRLISKKTAKFTQRFIHKLLISKALRYGPYVCNEGITVLPATHTRTCLYSPAA